jgi:hypothetical protein
LLLPSPPLASPPDLLPTPASFLASSLAASCFTSRLAAHLASFLASTLAASCFTSRLATYRAFHLASLLAFCLAARSITRPTLDTPVL